MQAQRCQFVAQLVKKKLKELFIKAFPTINGEVLIQHGPKNECEYVSPSAIKYFNMHLDRKTGSSLGCKTIEEFAQKIVGTFSENDVIRSMKVHDKGFIKILLKESLIQEQVNAMMQNLEYPELSKERVIIDFSSPNIAKEMHVGHLRSTIIGESMSRVLQYKGNLVKRVNHLGDWGTQFGMLIAYMKQKFPDYEKQDPQITDLDAYYKAARAKFDSDAQFKKKSQETVVELQAYDESCIKAWKSICQVSKNYFNKIYERLKITDLQDFGESFYNPMIPDIIKEVEAKGILVEDDTRTEKKDKKGKKKGKEGEQKQKKEEEEEGKPIQPKKQVDNSEEKPQKPVQAELNKDNRKAKCIFIEKYQIPLMIVKTDGGYGYDTTDLAAIKYRLFDCQGDRLIYITDLGQRQHFEMIFAAAKKMGWLKGQRANHMGFGVIMDENKKKFSTRKGETVKLMDLLNEAKQKALEQLKDREKDPKEGEEGSSKEQVFTALKPEEYEDAAEKISLAAIKYYDLKQNRTSDYVFNFDKMLDPRGNTAVYLIYAYVRICSIIRKSGMTSQQITELAQKRPFKLTHPDERILAGMLIKFFDIIDQCAEEMHLNRITDFIYEIAVKIQENYKKYRILNDEHFETRIILCECIRKTLEKAFYMVGIVPIEKI